MGHVETGFLLNQYIKKWRYHKRTPGRIKGARMESSRLPSKRSLRGMTRTGHFLRTRVACTERMVDFLTSLSGSSTRSEWNHLRRVFTACVCREPRGGGWCLTIRCGKLCCSADAEPG